MQDIAQAREAGAHADTGFGALVTGGTEGDKVIDLIGSLGVHKIAEWDDVVYMVRLPTFFSSASLASELIAATNQFSNSGPVCPIVILAVVP